MNQAAHVIRRQTLELMLTKGHDAPALQAEVQRIVGEAVVPVMDRVMSAQVPHDQILRIDRLELDLGQIDVTDMQTQFLQRIAARLEEALSLEWLHASSASSIGSVQADTVQRRAPSARSDPQQSALEAVGYFLRTGLVPWWHRQQDAFDLDSHLAGLLSSDTDGLLHLLTSLPATRAAQRLSRQLHRSTLERLILALLPKDGDSPLKAMQQLRGVLEGVPDAASGDDGSIIFGNVLEHLLTSPQPASRVFANAVVRSLVESAERRGDLGSAWVSQLRQVATTTLPGDARVHQWLHESMQQLQAGSYAPYSHALPAHDGSRGPRRSVKPERDLTGLHTDRSKPSAPRSAEGLATGGQDVGPPDTESLPVTSAPTEGGVADVDGAAWRDEGLERQTVQTEAAKQADELLREAPDLAEGHFLANAGLVLLWPYLPRFFQQLGLALEGDFVSEAARERAVLLLEYLASGETEFNEGRLLLNKLLCGWPVLETVARALLPTESEVAESDELLTSMVGHWQSLRNTSRNGLREAFLCREGRLNHDDLGWQLVVNRSGYDVLLDSLPWAIGLIRLPWMGQALRVEW